MKVSAAPAAILIGFVSTLALPANAQPGAVSIICGVQVVWCNSVQNAFSRETGITVNMIKKSAGDAFEQLMAESANPKADV